jgi:hypothetical protein
MQPSLGQRLLPGLIRDGKADDIIRALKHREVSLETNCHTQANYQEEQRKVARLGSTQSPLLRLLLVTPGRLNALRQRHHMLDRPPLGLSLLPNSLSLRLTNLLCDLSDRKPHATTGQEPGDDRSQVGSSHVEMVSPASDERFHRTTTGACFLARSFARLAHILIPA